MVKYNQQKQTKEAQIKPYEKMLLDNQNKYDTDVKGDKIEEKLLEDERSDKDGAKGDKIYEKMQEDVRTGSPDKNTEGQLNEGSTKYNNAKLRDDDGEPLMDYHKATEDAEIADFTKAESGTKKEKMFWDKYVNSQIPPKGGNESLNELTKIVDNDQSSQLLSNYNTREEMRKATPATKSASADLKDADALLYHIYREASENGRELTGQEKTAVEDINNYKTNVLVTLQKEADDDLLLMTSPRHGNPATKRPEVEIRQPIKLDTNKKLDIERKLMEMDRGELSRVFNYGIQKNDENIIQNFLRAFERGDLRSLARFYANHKSLRS